MSLIPLWRGGDHERRLNAWRNSRSCGATITDGLMELDRDFSDFSDFSEFIASCAAHCDPWPADAIHDRTGKRWQFVSAR